jgi:hypothetical protein
MDPVTAMAIANGAFTILEAILPQLQEMAKKGQISPEIQQTLNDRVDRLSPSNPDLFKGPEWKKSTEG